MGGECEEGRAVITIITPTGGRPQAFALCEHFMRNQSYRGPKEWIVVDDMVREAPTKLTMGQTLIVGPRPWVAGLNTQRFNMEAALQHAKGDYIFVYEDDDAISPMYIEVLLDTLKRGVKIVGLSNSKYYNLNVPGYKFMGNYAHSSLSTTAIHKDLLPLLLEAVNSGDLYFDVVLWRKCREKGIPMALLANTNLSVGIKGMPGRPGITGSHKDKRGYQMDPGHAMLKSWLGRDYQKYVPYLKEFKGVNKNVSNTQRQTEVIRKSDRSLLQPGRK